jgi:hypothetical protein
MKKVRFTSALIVLLTTGISFAKYSGGTGEPNDPYRIATPNDLNDIGNHTEDFDKSFVMVNDINLADYTGTQFNIIGKHLGDAFSGVFDGNGHSIRNLSGRGFFWYINGAQSRIKSLRLIDPNVDTGGVYLSFAGCLAAFLRDGLIDQCHIENGRLAGIVGDGAGGLLGFNEGRVQGCSFSGSVNITMFEDNVGGLVGNNNVEILESYCHGNVAGDEYVGGLVGRNHGQISHCYSVCAVSGTADVGGFVGRDVGGVYSGCFWNSDASPDVNGIGNVSDPNVIGPTTAEMMQEATFAGWDFVEV